MLRATSKTPDLADAPSPIKTMNTHPIPIVPTLLPSQCSCLPSPIPTSDTTVIFPTTQCCIPSILITALPRSPLPSAKIVPSLNQRGPARFQNRSVIRSPIALRLILVLTSVLHPLRYQVVPRATPPRALLASYKRLLGQPPFRICVMPMACITISPVLIPYPLHRLSLLLYLLNASTLRRHASHFFTRSQT